MCTFLDKESATLAMVFSSSVVRMDSALARSACTAGHFLSRFGFLLAKQVSDVRKPPPHSSGQIMIKTIRG